MTRHPEVLWALEYYANTSRTFGSRISGTYQDPPKQVCYLIEPQTKRNPDFDTKGPASTHGVAWVGRPGPGSGAGERISAGEILEEEVRLRVLEESLSETEPLMSTSCCIVHNVVAVKTRSVCADRSAPHRGAVELQQISN